MWYRCGLCIERFVDDRIVRTLRGPGLLTSWIVGAPAGG